MKIDGTQMAETLLQRMQQAHDAPRAERASEAGSQNTFQLDELQPARGPEPTAGIERTQLDTDLRATAEKALRGEFSTAREVRTEVVEHILRERWEGKVGRAQTKKMIRKLTPTLVDDPEFTRQVDEMLIMAARDLGSSDR